MPTQPPPGDPAPADGSLPARSMAELGQRGFGVYVHVPFCASRCGYCDFNTYTATELGGGASAETYADAALLEMSLAARVLGERVPPAQTVFFGGGTPTLLPAADLVRLLDGVRQAFGLAPDAEVSTEANPESVDEAYLAELREGGFTRLSLGMQSARPHVLAVLERRHTPGRAEEAVAAARRAGFEHVNLDLIYGTPGETDADWRASLDAVVGAGVDHVSAYALIVEDGTRLARQVDRGLLPAPDDDVLADRYEQADRVLSAAGLGWYEVSNWAAGDAARCRHNELYWLGGDWWGIGPGAHSHVGGTRWWNVRHPAAYAEPLAAERSPAQAREILDAPARMAERVLLGVRLKAGLDLAGLSSAAVAAAGQAAADGLLEPDLLRDGRAVLTMRGRLLADAVVLGLVE
ncbi:MAG: radical SAM family heme chaperone HemW [Actinomycetota bacterium]|nr:radical SAM family heme chaperone HemW [Actinomycetota bacterium]